MTLPDRTTPPVPLPDRALPPILQYTNGRQIRYGNAAVSVLLPADGDLHINRPGRSSDIKFGWWRHLQGDLRVQGYNLARPEMELFVRMADGYGPTGFQASTLEFPVPGCWRVSASLDDQQLEFVVRVLDAAEQPRVDHTTEDLLRQAHEILGRPLPQIRDLPSGLRRYGVEVGPSSMQPRPVAQTYGTRDADLIILEAQRGQFISSTDQPVQVDGLTVFETTLEDPDGRKKHAFIWSKGDLGFRLTAYLEDPEDPLDRASIIQAIASID
ncbi:MAG: hypothetical protein ACRDGT_09370 [Candidatus Limnocylindria bacterium]